MGKMNLPHHFKFYDNFEISAAGGGSWFNIKDTHMTLTYSLHPAFPSKLKIFYWDLA
jgi:hypothetical protein